MSKVNTHNCDSCGKQSTSSGEWGSPKGWFSIDISQEGQPKDFEFDKEACSLECLQGLFLTYSPPPVNTTLPDYKNIC